MQYWIITSLIIAAWWYTPQWDRSDTPPPISAFLASDDIADYWQQADQVKEFVWPDDHGPHPDFATEWWYLVMHLHDTRQPEKRYAAQWTVFRQALSPLDNASPSDSALWSHQQHYLGHSSWLRPQDQTSETHHISLRESSVWASSSVDAIICGGMRLEQFDQPQWQLTSPAGDGTLHLKLSPTRDPILHGEQGLSRKDDQSAASYYYSFTRIAVSGYWQSADDTQEQIPLAGEAWFDHEWFSNGLGRQLGGWDWWCWRLDNGDDLMLGWLRDPDGKRLPDFTGTWRRRWHHHRHPRQRDRSCHHRMVDQSGWPTLPHRP